MNAAYVDGHVEFLSNDVEPFTLALQVDIRDSEAGPERFLQIDEKQQ